MNEQSASTGTTPPPRPDQQAGPRVSAEQMRDVSRLRRSTTDRYVAGVAGGLGRHFDVDPTVIRVLLAVLTLFGGAGLLLYVAVWLFVPEDGAARAAVDLRPETQKVLLVAAAVIAALIVFGTPFTDNGWGFGFPVPLLLIGLVGIGVYSLVRNRGRRPVPPPAPWGSTPYAAPSAATPATTGSPSTSTFTTGTSTTSTGPGTEPQAQEGTTMSTTDVPSPPPMWAPAAPTGQQPPAWMPPPVPAYVPPPRPRRTGLVLFWPTLALIAIGLGTLGILDASMDVYVSAYAALALTVVAVMLLVGAFVGRPGGLIALGLVAAAAVGITSGVDAAAGGSVSSDDVVATPVTAAAVRSDYTIGNGSLTVDLTEVRDLAGLDGRTIDVSLNAGKATVRVPDGVNVDVRASIRYAGDIVIGDDFERGGFNQEVNRTLTSSAGPSAPTVDLLLGVQVGKILVVTDGATTTGS